MAALDDRVARLEAGEQIGQLVARYAVAVDARDLAALADLYAPEVRDEAMSALRAELPPGVTFHLMAAPALTFEGADAAHGVVGCRAEAEIGAEWLVTGLRYDDRYVRRDGTWYLLERTRTIAYACDVLARP